jgi:thiol-disulfide isomerase/thioredoxin
MKKTLLLAAALFVLPLVLFAADRVVVLEIGTATWCPPCAAAARGAEDLAEEHPGKVLIVEYHNSDEFSNTYANTRNSFYGVTSIPTAVFDGVEKVIGSSGSNNFFTYNAKYNARASIEPPLTIDLKHTIDAFASTSGTVRATITNVSAEEVSGYIRFTVTESHIPYSWQGLDHLEFVERDMLPNASGQFISIAAGADTLIVRDYFIDESWSYFTEDENIEFGCFVQDLSKEIIQAAVIEFGDTVYISALEEYESPFSLSTPTVVSKQDFVELSLDASLDVDVSLYNSLGRRLGTLHRGVLDAGTHRIEVKADVLPAGVYFINVRAGVYNKVGKLLILH